MNHFEANDLLDQYGSLLTARQQEILEYYYQDDLSISEIAENLSISRAAVAKTIKSADDQLEAYEQAIHACSLHAILQQVSQMLDEEQKKEFEKICSAYKFQ